MTESEIFKTKVVPIMEKVRKDLLRKQSDELNEKLSSPLFVISHIIPDGSLAANQASLESLKYEGQWNSKTVEDYIEMVKAEIKKQNIQVTPEIERLMLDHMVEKSIPRSSLDYIVKSAKGRSLFGFAEEFTKSDLQKEIDQKAETLYNPSRFEKGAGMALGAAADVVALGGLGGTTAGAMKVIGGDIAANMILDKVLVDETKAAEIQKTEVPQKESVEPFSTSKEEKPVEQTDDSKKEEIAEDLKNEEESKREDISKDQNEETRPHVTTSGWQSLIATLGLGGMQDIGHNMGYILAMLPDILLGILTGDTKVLNMRENLVPLASIMAGMFVRNPLLKTTLLSLGGANLLNKAGHREMAKHNGYRIYEEEALNPRIKDVQISGRTFLALIDNVPVSAELSEKVVDAYQKGALPLSTLSNAVLLRADKIHEMDTSKKQYEEKTKTESIKISQK